jgi:hypothetical protein
MNKIGFLAGAARGRWSMERENLSFEEEMDVFFKCFEPKFRSIVERDNGYQEAAKQKNAVRCQEIAMERITVLKLFS